MREHARVDGALLDDASVGRDVAVQHAQGAHLGKRVVMRAAHLAIGRLGALGDVLGKRAHAGKGLVVKQAEFGQLVHDHRHAADGVQVDERARAGRLQLHQMRRAGACGVPVVHRDGAAGLHGDGGQVQNRVGGAAESHVALHGVVDGRRGDDVSDGDALFEKLHHLHAGMLGQAQALGVDGRDGAVAGKRDAERLAQAVHGVGGEHARAAAAGGAGGVLEVLELFLGHSAGAHLTCAVEQRVQVGGGAVGAAGLMSGKHRAAGDEHRRDVHAQGTQDHAGDDLVAVRDADRAVEGVTLHGALEAVGDGLARHQRIMHAVVIHGQAVAHADGRDLERHAAGHVDAGLDRLADLVEVVVTGDDIVAGVEHRDKRPRNLLIGKSVGLQQTAVRGACNALFHGIAAKLHKLPSSLSSLPARGHKKILLQAICIRTSAKGPHVRFCR